MLVCRLVEVRDQSLSGLTLCLSTKSVFRLLLTLYHIKGSRARISLIPLFWLKTTAVSGALLPLGGWLVCLVWFFLSLFWFFYDWPALKAGESSTRCCSLYCRFFLTAITTLCKLARNLLYTRFGVCRLRYLCQQHKGSLEL